MVSAKEVPSQLGDITDTAATMTPYKIKRYWLHLLALILGQSEGMFVVVLFTLKKSCCCQLYDWITRESERERQLTELRSKKDKTLLAVSCLNVSYLTS